VLGGEELVRAPLARDERREVLKVALHDGDRAAALVELGALLVDLELRGARAGGRAGEEVRTGGRAAGDCGARAGRPGGAESSAREATAPHLQLQDKLLVRRGQRRHLVCALGQPAKGAAQTGGGRRRGRQARRRRAELLLRAQIARAGARERRRLG
jgi:hypothetical protein